MHKRRLKVTLAAAVSHVHSPDRRLTILRKPEALTLTLLSDMDLFFLVDMAKEVDQSADECDDG
jgi:hypothetical protein